MSLSTRLKRHWWAELRPDLQGFSSETDQGRGSLETTFKLRREEASSLQLQKKKQYFSKDCLCGVNGHFFNRFHFFSLFESM